MSLYIGRISTIWNVDVGNIHLEWSIYHLERRSLERWYMTTRGEYFQYPPFKWWIFTLSTILFPHVVVYSENGRKNLKNPYFQKVRIFTYINPISVIWKKSANIYLHKSNICHLKWQIFSLHKSNIRHLKWRILDLCR